MRDITNFLSSLRRTFVKNGNASLCRLNQAKDHPQQRRFPPAVRPDNADKIIVINPKIMILQDRLVVYLDGDIFNSDNLFFH